MLVLSRPDNVQAKFGFPTKVGEYLLSGRPIVVTDVGNITDFLKDGINAYLTQPGDYEAFAKKMVEVSSDTTRANEIGRRGRETALLSFNSEIESLKLMKFMNMKV
jgi:glycosyltransferase involved in cell wall biosynthesis